MANLNVIMPLLLFEHQYLAYFKTYLHQLVHMSQQHSYLGKRFADFVFMSLSLFHSKKDG